MQASLPRERSGRVLLGTGELERTRCQRIVYDFPVTVSTMQEPMSRLHPRP
jgi:hypothetical protein